MSQDPLGRGLQTADGADIEQQDMAMVLTAADVGEFEWDLVRDNWVVSQRMAAITGLWAGAASARGGEALYDLVYPADIPIVRQAVQDGLTGPGRSEVRFRLALFSRRRPVWLVAGMMAVRGADGAALRLVGAVRDVSAERSESDQRDALVAELDHRVKNVLAAVQSLAAQSARRTTSLDSFMKTFFGRLQAMAAAHTLLTSTRWRGAAIGHIAAAELGGLAQGQAHWHGPDLVLTPRATHALTLALHELTANAMRYGALSNDSGVVEVSWWSQPNGGFELLWAERNGPTVAAPRRQGFGSTLLQRVTGRELGGEVVLDFRPEGFRARLSADSHALAAPSGAVEPAPGVNEEASFEAEPAVDGLSDVDIRGMRVLIVEDAVLLALELEAGLQECGAVVVGSAADLDEAIGMLDLPFDAAVLDANLNGRLVTPVAKVLAARKTPFIFATGYGDRGDPPEGFDAPVVRKPYNIRQITHALAAAVSGRESKDALNPL